MNPRTKNILQSFLHNTYLHIFLLTLIIAGTQWYNWGIFGDPDAQYHLTVAKLMPLWPTSTQFLWLPFTSWGSAYADQHYLFHLLLKPFALLNIGQFVIIFGFLANILGFNWLLKQVTSGNRVPWLWLYTLGSADLFTRVSLIKAEATGLVFLYLFTGLLLKRKWPWLLPLMTLYTLWYGGSTLALVIVATYCAIEFFLTKTILLKPVYWTLGGLLLAFLIHPYRTTLPALLYDQITRAGLLRAIPGGNEWYSQPTAFLPDNIIIFLPWAISLFYVIKNKHYTTQTHWFLSLCGSVLFFLGLYSNRITLYWVPFALLCMAVILPEPIQKLYKKIRDASTQKIRKVLLLLLLILGCLRGLENILDITTAIHRIGLPIHRLQAAAEWLAGQTQPGDVVVNTSWHIFPELFYWNTKNTYIAGEDPAFLWIADPSRYAIWNQLETPLSPRELATSMTAFNSSWLIAPKNLYQNLPKNSYIEQVYEDNAVHIIRLIKPKKF